LKSQPIDLGRQGPTEASALVATFAPGRHVFPRLLTFGPASFWVGDRRQSIFVDARSSGDGSHGVKVRIRDVSGEIYSFSSIAATSAEGH
jgi:hypothetical protein